VTGRSATCNYISVGTSITYGPKFVVNSASRTDGGLSLDMAALDGQSAIVCYKLYQGGSGNMAGNCNRLAVAVSYGSASLSKSADLLFSTNFTSDISVAALGDSSAIVCFRDHGSSRNDNSGMCQHISMSGASITSGGNLVIAEWYPGIYSGSRSGSVAALDSSTAVVCYSDKGSTPTANAGTCKKLSVSAMSATSLTAGAGTVFASTGARDVNVVALDATNAIVCYNNLGNDEHGTCNHLGVSSTGTIVAGTAVEFVPTSNVYDISLTKQSASTALVCYRVNSMPSGVCKPLSVSGTSITVGADIVFFSGYMGNRPATTGVTATKALVCYGGDDNKGTCNLIA